MHDASAPYYAVSPRDKRTGDSLGWFTSRDIPATGNLKDAAPPLPAAPDELGHMKAALNGRPVWCAASTHRGEDEIILRAHEEVLAAHPNALLILAPRHPERRGEILETIHSANLNAAVRSQQEPIGTAAQVYLFDTIGEMGLAYRLSSLTFVCGSLSCPSYKIRRLPLPKAAMMSCPMCGRSFSRCYQRRARHEAARLLDTRRRQSRFTRQAAIPAGMGL